MSQYTISIKSIINIKSHPAPYNDIVFADTAKKIERGREIFFNFNYAGDEDFKRLFENAFLIEYLERDIYCNDVDLFLIALRNDIEIKSPLFYKRYEAIKTLEKNLLSKGETITSSGTFSENSSDSESTSDTRKDSSSGGSNNKSLGATYPQNLIVTNRIESVKYSDSGAFSENSSTASSSGNSTRTGKRDGSRNGENENVSTREINSLDKIELYIAAQRDIIDEFVKSLSPLFIHIF